MQKAVNAAGRRGWAWPLGVFAATLLVYGLISPLVLTYLEPPSGDQPHYLMTVISLVDDRDADEANNYGADRSYDRIWRPGNEWPPDFRGIIWRYPPVTTNHRALSAARPPDEWYSKHGLGLPLLLVPGWVLGAAATPPVGGLTARGEGGWPGTVFELNLLGALVAVQVFLLARDVSGSRAIGLAVWAPLAFSLPLLSHSLLIFPEVPAALLTIYAFRRLNLGWAANASWQLALVGLCIGYLPWLNNRFLPIAAALLAFAGYRRRHGHDGARLAALLFPVGLFTLALFAYHHWLNGSPVPRTGDYEGFYVPPLDDPGTGPHAGWRPLVVAALGLLVDAEVGLLVHAPLYALAPAGMLALWRLPDGRAAAVALAALIVPYGVLVADFREWPGGFSPAARYLTPVAPLLAAPLAGALAVARRDHAFHLLYGVLTMVGLGLAAMTVHGIGGRIAEREGTLIDLMNGQPALFGWMAGRGLDLTGLLPSLLPWTFDRGAAFPWAQLLGALSLLIAPSAFGAWLLSTPPGSAARDRLPTVTSRRAAIAAGVLLVVLISVLPWSIR